MFTGIIKEVFAGCVGIQSIQIQHQMQPDMLRRVVKTPTSSRYFKSAVKQEDSSQLLREESIKAGLSPSQPWMGKVEQLLAFTQLKHGKKEDCPVARLFKRGAHKECVCGGGRRVE